MGPSKLEVFGVVCVISWVVLQSSGVRNHLSPSRALASQFKNAGIPEQIHLSLGNSTTEVVVVWSSPLAEEGYVEYGDSVNTLTKIPSHRVELTQNSEQAVKFLHRAVLPRLTPGGHYSYRIVSKDLGHKSETFTFDLPHQDPGKAHTFLVTADLGLISKSLQFLIHEALNNKYEIVFHIGDIAYNLDLEGGSRGDDFMRRVQKFTTRIPYMTTPGDHEREISGWRDTFYHYRHRFSMPMSSWPMSDDKLWYSMDVGLTHFVSINTEALGLGTELGRQQVEWLRADLAEANLHRDLHPWIIVMGHKPMYCTKSVMEQSCDTEQSPLRDAVEDLFFEYGVDVYISGHKHCYERSWPLYQGKVFQNNYVHPMAPVYIIIGSMGYEYLVDKQRSDPYWLAFASSDEDKELYARLTVHNSTSLVWSVRAAVSNEEVDKVLIVQKSHKSFGVPGPQAFEQKQAEKDIQDHLPPQPFFIAEDVSDPPWHLQYRRPMLYLFVFSMAFILLIFLKQTKMYRYLRL